MRRAVIVSAARTAIGAFGGALAGVSASSLAAVAIKAAVERAGLSPADVDEVLIGCILQAGQGQNPARQAALRAGIPVEAPASTINMVCGSGLRTVAMAAQHIAIGDCDVVVAGGTESMSMAPYLLDKARTGYRMGHGQVTDVMIRDGLWCAIGDTHMGITAENLAEKYGISRKEQDAFAAESQAKAAAAVAAGKFADEIVPMAVPSAGRGRVCRRRAPEARHHSGVAGAAASSLQGGRHGHRRQLVRHQRRGGGPGGHGGGARR